MTIEITRRIIPETPARRVYKFPSRKELKQLHPPADPLLNSDEAAAHLGMSSAWLKQNWRKLHLTPIKIGGSLRWRLSMLETYIQKNTLGVRNAK